MAGKSKAKTGQRQGIAPDNIPSGRRRVLIVDGHSIIHAWPELHSMHGRGRPEERAGARETLVRELRSLQDNSGDQVVVVFDGRGARLSTENFPDSVQIFYSPEGKTADDIIERLVAKYASTLDVTVATNDGLERQTVMALGGSCMDADYLRREVDNAHAAVTREIIARKRENKRW